MNLKFRDTILIIKVALTTLYKLFVFLMDLFVLFIQPTTFETMSLM